MGDRIQLLETLTLRGPNNYSFKPCIKMTVDIGELEESPSNTIPGFNDRLKQLIPSLIEHTCSEGVRGGFLSRLEDGTWPAHIIEHVAIEIQNLAGIPVSFGRARGAERTGVYNIVYAYLEEEVGRLAGRLAVHIVENLIDGRLEAMEQLLAEEVQRFKEIREDRMLGPSTRSIVDAARARGIPFLRLNDQSFVQLGWGARQRRIQATIASTTSFLGVEVAGDKDLTKRLLRDHGIPVPRGRLVRSLEGAREVAEDLGFPVVVKPLDASHGRGITTRITSDAELAAAFEDATRHRSRFIVERHVEGYDFRMLVINHKFVAAAQRIPARVVGDGTHTVRELVELLNQDERRGFGHEKVLTKIVIDDMTESLLRRKGLTLDHVPADDERIYLKTTANLSTGGFAVDVTDQVHPDNVHLAERIARIVGLDIAGIDVMATRLDVPIAEVEGAILEVNAAPGFRMHLAPAEGTPRNVAEPVVDMLFPPGSTARIPLVAVTGTNGKTTTARLLAHIAQAAGHTVGLATSDGIYIRNERTIRGDRTGPLSAQIVLRDPTVDFAVLETARGGMLREGLGWDWCDVSVITNVAADHLGLRDIHTLEAMAHVKALVAERTRPEGLIILNAENEWTAKIPQDNKHIKAPLAYFSLDPAHPIFQAHVAAGGFGAAVEEGVVTLFQSGMKVPLQPVSRIPLTFEGHAAFNVQNILGVVLAAHHLGLDIEAIKQGLLTFFPSISQTPGRANLIPVGDFTVMVDYAHNPHAYQAIAPLVTALKKARVIGIVSCPGDRREEEYEEVGKLAAGIYDHIIIREDDDLRGRQPREVADRIAHHARRAGLAASRIDYVARELDALARALEMARKDDLVVMCADRIDNVHRFLERYKAEH